MKKLTYRVLWRGVEYTRTTARTYTHVVMVDEYQGKATSPGAFTWVGRADLVAGAEKSARRAGYTGVHVIPLEQP